MVKDSQPTYIAKHFENHLDDALKSKFKAIPPPVIQKIITDYWKNRKIEQKWHAFYRKFWQNPDYNEPDPTAAYRKISEKDKIKTRPKMQLFEKRL